MTNSAVRALGLLLLIAYLAPASSASSAVLKGKTPDLKLSSAVATTGKVIKARGVLDAPVRRKVTLQQRISELSTGWTNVDKKWTSKKGVYRFRVLAPAMDGSVHYRVLFPAMKVEGTRYERLVSHSAKMSVHRDPLAAPANFSLSTSGENFVAAWETVVPTVGTGNAPVSYRLKMWSTQGPPTVEFPVAAISSSRQQFVLTPEQSQSLFGAVRGVLFANVTAVDSNGYESAQSTSQTASMPPGQPITGLSATGVTGAVVLNWDASSGGPGGFRIYASPDGPDFPLGPGDLGLQTTTSTGTHTFEALIGGTWYFAITTIDKFGIESLPSRTSGTALSIFNP